MAYMEHAAAVGSLQHHPVWGHHRILIPGTTQSPATMSDLQLLPLVFKTARQHQQAGCLRFANSDYDEKKKTPQYKVTLKTKNENYI